MLYTEHAPAPALRPHVACYWTLRGVATAATAHRVLPDGCLDLLFDLGTGSPAARVIGVMTTAALTGPSPGGSRIDLLGVRFRPGEAAPFLALAARETRDRALAIRDVCGGWGHALAGRLQDEREGATRLTLLDAALLARGRRRPPDGRLRGALALIGRIAAGAGSQTPLGVASLAARVGVGERHLLRLFDDFVGIGPKAFARVARMQAVVAAIDALAPRLQPRWAELAAAHGYADQAHMIRELRALTGVTPSALFRERVAGKLGVSELSNPPAALTPTFGA